MRRAIGMGITVFSVALLVGVQLAAEAQEAAKVYRVGWLGPAFPSVTKPFLEELGRLGWIEGRTFTIEYRAPNGDYDRLPAVAAELAQLQVDVIVTFLTVSTRAAQRATTTTPIVFAPISDPVGEGFVKSLAHPGGNLTGMTAILPEVSGKSLELLAEAVPDLSRVAVLWQPGPTFRANFDSVQAVAQALGVTLQSLAVQAPEELEPAFSAMRKERAEALIVLLGPLLWKHRTRIMAMAVNHRLPVTSDASGLARAGGLLGYGPHWRAMMQRTAHYVDRILKGAQPADLPVEQPTKFELVINLKTAKALGLTIPESVLVRADEVIE